MGKDDLALLQPGLRPITLGLRYDMEQPNKRIETVYFMEAGIASVVAVQPDETQVEVGLIGHEGMTGIAVVLGGDQSPHSTYIQVAGEGQRIAARDLRKAMNASESLRRLTFQIRSGFYGADRAYRHRERACHDQPTSGAMDFMAHDRTRNDALPLTHESSR